MTKRIVGWLSCTVSATICEIGIDKAILPQRWLNLFCFQDRSFKKSFSFFRLLPLRPWKKSNSTSHAKTNKTLPTCVRIYGLYLFQSMSVLRVSVHLFFEYFGCSGKSSKLKTEIDVAISISTSQHLRRLNKQSAPSLSFVVLGIVQ